MNANLRGVLWIAVATSLSTLFVLSQYQWTWTWWLTVTILTLASAVAWLTVWRGRRQASGRRPR